MTDFFYNLMHPLPNAVTTVIMGVLVVYWLFVLLSGTGLDDLDLGFDFDVDIPETDIETDVDAGNDTDTDTDPEDAGAEKRPGFFIKFLQFLNVGKVPFMLIFSTFKFFLWIGSLITTQFINVTTWGAWSLAILIPLAVIALFISKGVTNPLVKVFKELGYKGEDEIDFLGRSGKMISSINNDKIGSAEVIIDKNPIRLNVKSIDGTQLNYGDYVIIADETKDKKIYLVSKEISIRNL